MSIYAGRFSGRSVVITGGASGLGLATAARLHQEGATVALWDRDDAALKEAHSRLGERCHPFSLDITRARDVEDTARRTFEALGSIDVLVAGAGISGPNAPVVDYPPEAWYQVIEVNLHGTFLSVRALVPYMLERDYGRVVIVGSIAGKEGNPNAAAYSCSKAALLALAKSVGKELARTGIRVNAVAPGVFKSRLLDQMTPAHVEYMLSRIPMGRFAAVEEVTALICWLASEEASFSTGAVFDASGGRATY